MCGRAERVEQHRHERVHGANCRALWRQARLKAVFEQPAAQKTGPREVGPRASSLKCHGANA